MLIQGSGVQPLHQPIVRSLLDTDFYKFTMLHFIWAGHHGQTPTTFAFTNRTRSVRLGDLIPLEAIREQLDHVLYSVHFTAAELDYLAGLKVDGRPIFGPGFIDFLRRQFRLSEYSLEVREEKNGRQLHLEFSGSWLSTTLWETIALSIINELCYRYALSPDERAIGYARGMHRLGHKVDALSRLYQKQREFNIIEFGTRRRFSREWQRTAIDRLVSDWNVIPFLLGVSNVAFAREFDLPPMGTMAHELFMIYAGVYDNSDKSIRDSQMRVFDDWRDLYGNRLSVALPDTFGSAAWFEDFGQKRAQAWGAARQDSGVPADFGEKLIRFYQQHEIDPNTKRLVPSDGLSLKTIVDLVRRFSGRIGLTFGWGTNLTNDLGFPALSLVVKATMANGHPLVKLSDNLAKATGPTDEVERYKRIFGYTTEFREECTY